MGCGDALDTMLTHPGELIGSLLDELVRLTRGPASTIVLYDVGAFFDAIGIVGTDRQLAAAASILRSMSASAFPGRMFSSIFAPGHALTQRGHSRRRPMTVTVAVMLKTPTCPPSRYPQR